VPWPLSFPFFIQGAGAAAEGALDGANLHRRAQQRAASIAFLAGYARKYSVSKIPRAHGCRAGL
jgi:hypothetical protein